jgi:hypothetical protein
MSAIDSQPKYDRERLLYRAQFVLGPKPAEEFPSWKRIRINDRVWLTAHSDLNITREIAGDMSLTLLGYILDPGSPKATDSDIVAELLPKLCSGDPRTNSPLCTNQLGGRWILIADDGIQIRLFSDALGQRQICYTSSPGGGEIWCASQPGTLALLLKLEVDPDAQKYVRSELQGGEKEYWWPYDTSLYREIRHLNPNHYLDYGTGTPRRFWPNGKLTPLRLGQAVKRGACLIHRLMMSAANRFPLQLMMTAGWDSRVVFCAAKDLTSNVSYLTFLRDGFTLESADVSVPRRLLQKFGRTQDILPVPNQMDEGFSEIYMQNMAAAHEVWGPIAQALYEIGPPQKLRVTGGGSETIRQQFRPSASGLTPEILAHYGSADGQEFAVRAFRRWLADVPKNLPIGILDLFYWEQKCGNWLAVGQTEWDITGNSSFTPYNCRALLATLLAVNEEYRLPPFYELHRALIKELWPEALSVPINPHKTMYREKPNVKSVTKYVLVKTHLLDYVPKRAIAFAKKLLP